MKIVLLMVGKTDASYFAQAVNEYAQRIMHYVPFELTVIPDLKNSKNLSQSEQKEREAVQITKCLQPGDEVIILDERGKDFSSVDFSRYIDKKMCSMVRRLVFVIGGPYGFSPKIYEIAKDKIRLSSMTFSHQMVRVIFLEQLYRAYTILRGEPYHHV